MDGGLDNDIGRGVGSPTMLEESPGRAIIRSSGRALCLLVLTILYQTKTGDAPKHQKLIRQMMYRPGGYYPVEQ